MKKDKEGFGLMIGLEMPKAKRKGSRMLEKEDDEDSDLEDEEILLEEDEEDMELEDEEILLEDEEEDDFMDSESMLVEDIFNALDNRDVEAFKSSIKEFIMLLKDGE